MSDRDDSQTLTPIQALARLVGGHRRFLDGLAERPDQTTARRTVLSRAQHPFAAIFSCADSRVAPEILFDQGLGDLFVVRSAGHVLDHAILGTLEFGVARLGTPLLLVLGHSRCGAVQATLDAVTSDAEESGTDIDTLVQAIAPAVRAASLDCVPESQLLTAAVRHHVAHVVAALRAAPIISTAMARGSVRVVGALYHLGTGEVDYLDHGAGLT